MEVYDGQGQCLQQFQFEDNVQCAIQDEDTLIVAYQNGGLATYNWSQNKLVNTLKGVGPIKSIAITNSPKVSKSERILVCGCENGELDIFRFQK